MLQPCRLLFQFGEGGAVRRVKAEDGSTGPAQVHGRQGVVLLYASLLLVVATVEVSKREQDSNGGEERGTEKHTPISHTTPSRATGEST